MSNRLDWEANGVTGFIYFISKAAQRSLGNECATPAISRYDTTGLGVLVLGRCVPSTGVNASRTLQTSATTRLIASTVIFPSRILANGHNNPYNISYDFSTCVDQLRRYARYHVTTKLWRRRPAEAQSCSFKPPKISFHRDPAALPRFQRSRDLRPAGREREKNTTPDRPASACHNSASVAGFTR